MKISNWMRIVWPAFLSACLLEMLVFALIDPQDIQWLGRPLELSRQGIYSLAFFVFWGISLLSSTLTVWLAGPPADRLDGQDH